MTARTMAGGAVLLTIAATAGAQQSDRWSGWKLVAPVRAGHTAIERYVAVTVPAEVTAAASPGWSDLRVVDDQGAEVPFALRSRAGGTAAEWRASRVLDRGVAAEQFTQAVADTGEQARVHNAARLRVDGDEDFLAWVEVAVSDAAREWRVVRERAPIYRLRGEAMGEQLTLSYPETPARYLRLRLLDATRRYGIGGVDTAYEVTTVAELIPATIAFTQAEARPQQSAWISAQSARTTIAAFRIDTPQALFDRPVKIETSDEGSHWRHVASGPIFRTVERGQPRSQLDIRIPETSAIRWRVTIFNRDDAPLPEAKVTALAVPRRVVFMQRPGRSYSLLYSNPDAAAPQYEMVRLIDGTQLDAADQATLESSRANSAYRDPAPWTERHPLVVWSALVLVVLVLAGLAFRTLKSA